MSGRVLVVADDLTGANDTGVQFARAGWPTVLRLPGKPGHAGSGHTPTHDEPKPDDPKPDAPTLQGPARGATAVSTDARALGHEEARRTTRAAVEREGLAADDRLYLKVDSTLRGSVAGQLSGALDARRAAHPDALVVLCPAYPSMHRTVVRGRLLVRDVPVSRSPAGRDPVTPVTLDALTELVPGAVGLGTFPTAAQWAAALEEAGRRAPVVAVDARTDEELARLAEAVDLLGPRVVPAGSAGLAAPLAELWARPADGGAAPRRTADAPPFARRPLVLVSSHHAVAREQVAALAAAGTAPGAPPRGDSSHGGTPTADAPHGAYASPHEAVTVVRTDADELPEDIARPLPSGSGAVVLLSPEERTDSLPGARLATALARRAAHALTLPDHGFDAVVLVGGDGAGAFLAAVGAHGVTVRGLVTEGVPHGQIAGGPLHGLPVVTKAGGFGDRTTLSLLLRTLRTPNDSENPR
ncbi:four-carbon acid sugar kinase family protein [Streptomyces sp. XM4193]|uniref:four-carbon acid sugar kinase family protein n=1 Tax=Streptomyces sp. XM4193 TaxID=2929782 RepID=UPI001FFB8300|nr:four-carbon acid sugar kinase family protein [Streptomyces sp. XM4193]MCK1798041.1 four-carbon acid sugar kinase family protein [Streptomyces sp. XM4193]